MFLNIKMIKTQRNFTLLEVLVCLMLFAVVGYFTVTKGFSVYNQHLFEASSRRLQQELVLTKSLAVSYDEEILFVAKKTSQGVLIHRELLPHRKIPCKGLRSLFKKKILLKGISIKDSLSIYFYSNGASSLKEAITIVHSQKNSLEKKYIDHDRFVFSVKKI